MIHSGSIRMTYPQCWSIFDNHRRKERRPRDRASSKLDWASDDSRKIKKYSTSYERLITFQICGNIHRESLNIHVKSAITKHQSNPLRTTSVTMYRTRPNPNNPKYYSNRTCEDAECIQGLQVARRWRRKYAAVFTSLLGVVNIAYLFPSIKIIFKLGTRYIDLIQFQATSAMSETIETIYLDCPAPVPSIHY